GCRLRVVLPLPFFLLSTMVVFSTFQPVISGRAIFRPPSRFMEDDRAKRTILREQMRPIAANYKNTDEIYESRSFISFCTVLISGLPDFSWTNTHICSAVGSGSPARALRINSRARAVRHLSSGCGPGLRRFAGVGSSSRALDAACGAADAASVGQIFSNFRRQTKNAGSSPASPTGVRIWASRLQTRNFSITGSQINSYLSQNERGTISRS